MVAWKHPGRLFADGVIGFLAAFVALFVAAALHCDHPSATGRAVGLSVPAVVICLLRPRWATLTGYSIFGLVIWDAPRSLAEVSEHCPWLASLVVGSVGVVIGRRFRPPPPDGEPKCPFCGYVLYYAKGFRCPECGRSFELDEVSLEEAGLRDGVLYPKDRSKDWLPLRRSNGRQ